MGWFRRTPSTLAEELALPTLIARDLVPVHGLGHEALCARVIHELGAQGELGRYRPLRQRPGFPRALAATVHQLRMARIEPAQLEPHDPALARLLGRYALALDDAKLADSALVLAAATERARSASDPSARLPLLALDVLTRQQAEAEFITAICADRPSLCVVHPEGDERSSEHWIRALGLGPERASTALAPQTDLTRLQERLFSLDPQPAPIAFERGKVKVVSSPGEGREAVEVARGVVEAAERGVAFDQIAIVLRGVENYRAVVEEALARARLPAHFADGVRRPVPEGRALLALLRCAETGLGARAFAEYLSLSVTPELELEGEAGGVSPRHWERALIDSAVISGRERWQRRLNGRIHALQAELGELEADDPERDRRGHEIERMQALLRHAEPILDALGALPEGKTWGDWLVALEALANQALRTPLAVCEALAELAPLAPLGPVGLRDVIRVLSRRLGSVIARSSGSGAGRVFVGSVDDVLGRSFELVFVVGLAEKIFPPRIDPDPLLPDRIRALLGAAMLQPDERVAAERLAMRVAVGAARQRVVLSFPRYDVEHNRARVPSFYGLEALRAIDGSLPAFDELARRANPGAASRLGWPAPEAPEQAIDDAEYDLAMLARFRAQPDTRAGAARYFVLSNVHLARALRFRARRWTVRRFMATDGLVLDDASRALLAPHQFDARPYSATALSQFAACPYRFYLHAIVGLAARDDSPELDELDARQRGVLFHDTQRALLLALQERGWLPLATAQREAALELLQSVFAAVAAAARERYAPAIERVFDAALETTRNDLQQWLTRLAGDASWYADHMELGFGMERPERSGGAAPSVRLPSGLALVGAIDVVERRPQPDADGRIRLRATDHKTGQLPDKLGIISGGRVLQPALYALALERLFPDATVESGRLYFCTSRAGFLSHDVPLDARARAACDELSDAVGSHLQAGFFPAVPAQGACARCAYQTVCGPYEEERVGLIKGRADQLPRLSRLARLRGLP